ncbi:protein mono-ADP-ribosyltransferase PARP14 isoform X2 [Gadus morhua]|uniref:protein mono-ADP-ribosyltransferase PARP14 isoform X2 n=1 Tax=Gadus morhua TaxID=8049 RepID=UPI0011B84BC7|nr:protein mono-ADP-ribosyltransferase PARP14-like isoform X2 [Gadus morhua]
MAGKTLILEGLTADLDDQIKSKLSSYFQIKRRSGGGEISELYADPTDKRKVVLVYVNDKVRNEVLSRKTHQVDLKGSLGVVTLHVTLPEDVKSEPVLSSEADFVCYDEAKEDAALLRVTSERCRESLEMFFEQCIKDPILRKHGKNTWILQTSNKADMESVCASNLQQYGISVEVYKEKEEDGLVDRRRFVLSGLDDCCSSDTLSMYIHSCSQRAGHSWEAVGGDSIVVTFKEDIDGCQFMTKTFTKRFNNKKIEACRLELTKSVIVQGDMSQISEEFLTLYFSNKMRSGGDIIKSFVHVNQNKSIVITFEDWKVAQSVAERKHTLMKKELVAQLFYPDLQWVLTGQTHLQDNLSTDIAIPVTPDLLRFISCNEIFREELTSALQRVEAMVSFNFDSKHPQLELKMSMNKYSLGLLRHGSSWESNARREVQTHLEKYIVEHIPMKAEVWQAVKGSCPEVNVATALIAYKICSSELVVVGRWEEVETLVKEIKSKMEKARDQLKVVINTIEKEIQLDSKERLDLTLDLVRDELVNLDLSKNNENFTIHLKGLSEKVQTAETRIQEVQDTLTSKKLDSSHNLIPFLQSLDLTKFRNDHFSLDNIVAVVICGKESVSVLAKKGDIDRAENKLKEVIKQEALSISGEYNKETFGEQWKTFYAELKKELESTQNSQNVLIEYSGDKIELCGFRSVVDNVIVKVKGCLENKKVVTEDIPLKTLQEVEFVESFMNLPADPQLKALGVTILPCRSPQSPYLKVTATRDHIKEAIDVVNSHIRTITTTKYMYSKAGEAKILKNNNSLLKMQAKGLSCNLELSEQNITQRFSYDLKGGVTLALAQGNIAKQTSDILICPLVNMSYNNPVAQQFLENGGPEIKNAIDGFEKAKQSFLAGDVIMTNAGTLKSKKLIYAAIPVWGKSNSDLNSTYLVRAVLQSLVKGSNLHCGSLGMPALGCGTFGFPIKDSCEAIMKGINSFIGLGCGSMLTIHLTESDPKTVEGFKSALESLGYHPTDPTKTKIPLIPSSTGASHIVPLPSLQASNTIVIGRVSVILKKADITQENVDVIVNSSNQNLDLNTGVSGDILKAAGQSVVDECKKHGPQAVGNVALTGGGNLNCKHIAHIAGPAKTTASILQVLQLCESKQAATVSVPTIGTGKGGCLPEDSAKAILQGLRQHILCTPLSSLKTIFLVAFVDRTYEIIKKYFNKPRYSKTPRAGIQMMAVPVAPPLNQVKIKSALVELKQGNITAETVKAIVNSTNEDVNLKNGVSGAIFNAAGSAVEVECAKIRPLRSNDAGVTSGGSLQCDFIIHIVGPKSVEQAVERVKNVLKHCEDKNIPSVSFPAIGTGGGGMKFQDSVFALLSGIEAHFSKHKFSALKQIFLVVDQVKAMKECQQVLLSWTQVTQDMVDDDDSSNDSSGDEDNSGATTAEMLIRPVKVKLLCGDITKEKTDAIVSSTNTSLNLNSGVSGAILSAAGQTVVDECNNLGNQPGDGVVMTKPGNLAAKHIIHMVGQTKSKDIISSMLKVFKMCEDHKIQSVSFPALGTGVGKLCAVDVGNAMVTAVEEHIKMTKTTSLKDVHIVIFQTTMFQDFRKSLKKSKISASQGGSVAPTQQPSMCLAGACRDVSFPKVEVEVLGCCSSDLANVKKLVDDLVTKEWKLHQISSPYLALLLPSEKQAIVALSRSLQVCVSVSAPDKATVSGKEADVLTMVLQIEKDLQKAKERATRQEEEKRLWKTVRWEVCDREAWAELDPSVSIDLEHALHKKEQLISYTLQNQTYTVNLDKLERTDRNGTIARIKRTLKAGSEIAVIEPPPKWDRMDNKTLDIVDLSPTSEQYKKVQANFLQTSKDPTTATPATFTVVKIQRIQSKDQWQRYALQKQVLDEKYPHNKNEMDLYHGTTAEICRKVNSNGFNRSFCGRNATLYGNGTYFAKQSWYSCNDKYSNPDAQGLKYMYQARVLVGKPCLGTPGMVEPAPLDPNNPYSGLHDCAVNNVQNPFIYVVFSDAGAYPDYLISYKASL